MTAMQRVFVAGGSGLVGGAICRRLSKSQDTEIFAPSRQKLDLFDEKDVQAYLRKTKPDTVVLAAALVGGIGANSAHPVEFLTDNLRIQNNVMIAAQMADSKRLMFLGSSCIYPRDSPQPMKESLYQTGKLEPTNESYAIAKIAGIRLAESLAQEYGMRIFLPMPSNVYGPGDHFDPERSHVLSSLVMKFENARTSNQTEVTLWGTGVARREFIHCDDLADACVFLMQNDSDLGIVNIGSGTDISIRDLATEIAQQVGYSGSIHWDATKPDGMPRKLLDVTRMKSLGWDSKISLNDGISEMIEIYRKQSNPKSSVSL